MELYNFQRFNRKALPGPTPARSEDEVGCLEISCSIKNSGNMVLIYQVSGPQACARSTAGSYPLHPRHSSNCNLLHKRTLQSMFHILPILCRYHQFLSPVYVPPMPMPGYSSNASSPHSYNGCSCLLMPRCSSHLNANSLKYGTQKFKTVPVGILTVLGNFTIPMDMLQMLAMQ